MSAPSLSISFKPQDIWIGAYVESLPPMPVVSRTGDQCVGAVRWWTVYVCIVPMLPIRIRWARLHYDR